MLYSIIGIDKQNSLQDRLAVRPAHVARLQQLNDQGRLVLAGPNPAIDRPDPGEAGFSGSLIVAEFELDRLEDDDCDLEGEARDTGDCEEFEAPPFFVNLPLDETQVTVAAASITPDTYKELDFEIEDLGDDDFPAGVAEALLAE